MSEIALFAERISRELSLEYQYVRNTLSLLSEGATIPFIARYRKEKTGSMDEEIIAQLHKRMQQLEALDKRRESIIGSLSEMDKLSPELEEAIYAATDMASLEDLYLPYKPKRRTRASIAREKGLEPLAKWLLAQHQGDILKQAKAYLSEEKGIDQLEQALQGARDIIAEEISDDHRVRAFLRQLYHRTAIIESTLIPKKLQDAKTYQQYFDWEEPLSKAPSHRVLALLRARNEELLKVKIRVDTQKALRTIERLYIRTSTEAAKQVYTAITDAWKRLLEPSMENEVRQWVKEKADKVAIQVFSKNLRQLLLAPPLGQKVVLAIDPGFRTGCKLVVLDKQGQLVHNDTIFPHPPEHEVKLSIQKIKNIVNAYKVEVIAIGNGTAGRETEDLIRSIRFHKDVMAVMVNESGASVYSASKLARDEFPDYDISVRGAVSIGRRLIDPLAELVKIDPKSIGVGQYQHDVDQKALQESLIQTVESCVNAVGVELNTASEQLLSYVSGIGPQLAANIVAYRNENGTFKNRNELKHIPRLGEKAFEQSAGFLRIRNGVNPLDTSAVHPESYAIAEAIADKAGIGITDLIGKKRVLEQIRIEDFTDENIGKETVKDIILELEKPGRDPRNAFEMFEFAAGIRSMHDLKEGMILNGIITNITAFGAFVDIGVQQDGLVHLSQMASRYVHDPNEIVKINQKVCVKVLKVDIERKRINLSMKIDERKQMR
jgi:uncharacterized protein